MNEEAYEVRERLRNTVAELLSTNATLLARLRESTDELRCVLGSGENIARDDIRDQIAANEAALAKAGEA